VKCSCSNSHRLVASPQFHFPIYDREVSKLVQNWLVDEQQPKDMSQWDFWCTSCVMIKNKQIIGLFREALAGGLRSWLSDHTGEIIKAVACSARSPVNERIQRKPASEEMQSAQIYFTPAEVAERWQFHPESVRRIVRRGGLSVIRIGRQIRVPARVVENYERDALLCDGSA
jgi:excisionase family DNA binding protein